MSSRRRWATQVDCFVVPRARPMSLQEAPEARAVCTVSWQPYPDLRATTSVSATSSNASSAESAFRKSLGSGRTPPAPSSAGGRGQERSVATGARDSADRRFRSHKEHSERHNRLGSAWNKLEGVATWRRVLRQKTTVSQRPLASPRKKPGTGTRCHRALWCRSRAPHPGPRFAPRNEVTGAAGSDGTMVYDESGSCLRRVRPS